MNRTINETYVAQYGPWALVTGASSGIGEAYARKLASLGMNLVLVARRVVLLERLATVLRETYGVECRTLGIDLCVEGCVERLDTETADMDIGLVVSNAGRGIPGSFLAGDRISHVETLRLNALIPMELAYVFGRRLARLGRGGIVFVASIVAYTGSPYMASYAASKSYLATFGESFALEMESSGVDVLVLNPGPTRTEMVNMPGVDMKRLPLYWMEPKGVAEAGVANLGRRKSVVAGLPNRLMVWMMVKGMPRMLAMRIFGLLMKKTMSVELLVVREKSAGV